MHPTGPSAPRCSRRDLLRLGARGALGLGVAAALGPLAAADGRAQSPVAPGSPAPVDAAPAAPASPAATPDTAPAPGGSIALLLPRATGDQGAADELVAAMDRAAGELGVRATVVEAADPATWERQLDRLATRGNRVVIGAFPELGDAMAAVAAANPGTRFLHIDGDPDAAELPNLETVAFDTWLGWYLAGVLAGEVSITRQVGYVGAVADDAHHAAANAFAAAAIDRDPELVTDAALVPAVGDVASGVDLAIDQLGLGADIIAADAGPSDPAIVATAGQAAAFAIAGSEAFAAALPETVIATVAVLRGQALIEALGPALGSGWRPGTRRAGVADGFVELVVNQAFLDLGPAEMRSRVAPATDLVNSARAAIIAGRLEPARDVRPPA